MGHFRPCNVLAKPRFKPWAKWYYVTENLELSSNKDDAIFCPLQVAYKVQDAMLQKSLLIKTKIKPCDFIIEYTEEPGRS